MRCKSITQKTAALEALAREIDEDTDFGAVKTGLGIVATNWLTERPMIFKGSIDQAHGRAGTFVPGFGVKMKDAVVASCSAYPFFERKTVTTAHGDRVELGDVAGIALIIPHSMRSPMRSLR